MQAPTIEAGKLKIYFEKLDSIFINTIHPHCFLCGDYFTVEDKVCVTIKATVPMRFDIECFDKFIEGLGIFIAAEEHMKVHTNEIQ